MTNSNLSNFSSDDAHRIIKYIFDEATIREDGLVNITALASAYYRATGKRKEPKHWLVTKEATEAIAYVERVVGIPTSQSVITEHGVGTWVYADIAEIFSQWVSVEYRFAVVQLIKAAKAQKVVPVIEVTQPPVIGLLIDQSVKVAEGIDRIQDILGKSNPRLAQLLIDVGVNHFVEAHQPALPASAEFPDDKWYGAVQIADLMGIKTNESTRTKLGTYLGYFDLERVREERLCNGAMRKIWCYRDCPEVRDAIESWAIEGMNSKPND